MDDDRFDLTAVLDGMEGDDSIRYCGLKTSQTKHVPNQIVSKGRVEMKRMWFWYDR